jgi:hypothetical protein
MARMNWSRVRRDKSLRNPPRPELDSPISPKGQHPVPAPPPTPTDPAGDARPTQPLPKAGRPKARRRRLRTPRSGRHRTTFTCVSCQMELPISERSVGFPKRCSSCVRGIPTRQPTADRPASAQLSRQDRTAGEGSPRRSTVPSEGAQPPRRGRHQILVDRGMMWQVSCTCGWAHPGSFRKSVVPSARPSSTSGRLVVSDAQEQGRSWLMSKGP